MEQQQVLDKGSRVTLETGKQLLHLLAYALGQLAKKYDERKLTGKQSWKEFNKSPRSKEHIDFEEAQVNLKKFQKELKKSGVRFHFKDNKDGTLRVWFEAINKKVIEQGLEKAVKEIVTDPKKAKEKYMKADNELTPKEQIDKIKKASKGTDTIKSKKKGKSI